MKYYLFLIGIIPVVGILMLLNLAYGHSFQVENIYDLRMHRDIQSFSQELIKSGMTADQIRAFRSVLLDLNQHTLSYVSSEVFNLVGVFTAMVIIIMTFSIAYVSRLLNRKEDA